MPPALMAAEDVQICLLWTIFLFEEDLVWFKWHAIKVHGWLSCSSDSSAVLSCCSDPCSFMMCAHFMFIVHYEVPLLKYRCWDEDRWGDVMFSTAGVTVQQCLLVLLSAQISTIGNRTLSFQNVVNLLPDNPLTSHEKVFPAFVMGSSGSFRQS